MILFSLAYIIFIALKHYITFLLAFSFSASHAQTTFQKSYGLTSLATHAVFVHQHGDGGFTIIGEAAGISFIRTNADGDTMWTKLLNAGANPLVPTSASPTADGGFVITAVTDDQATQALQYEDAVVIKIDANGT